MPAVLVFQTSAHTGVAWTGEQVLLFAQDPESGRCVPGPVLQTSN